MNTKKMIIGVAIGLILGTGVLMGTEKPQSVAHAQESQKILESIHFADGHNVKKLIIRQKIPCYVVPDTWAKEDYSREEVDRKYHVKVDSHTLALHRDNSTAWDVAKPVKKDRIMKLNDPRIKKAKILLGDNITCLKKRNYETWEEWWWVDNKSWVLKKREEFKILNQMKGRVSVKKFGK